MGKQLSSNFSLINQALGDLESILSNYANLVNPEELTQVYTTKIDLKEILALSKYNKIANYLLIFNTIDGFFIYFLNNPYDDSNYDYLIDRVHEIEAKYNYMIHDSSRKGKIYADDLLFKYAIDKWKEKLTKHKPTNLGQFVSHSEHKMKGLPGYTKPKEPYLDESYIKIIFEILKPYFNEEEHEKLEALLNDCHIKLHEHLVFNGNVTMFADAFLHMYIEGYIIANSKMQLTEWVTANFAIYDKGKKPKCISQSYFNNLLSTKEPPSKRLKGLIELTK
jgi:hypothetical protein